MTSGRGGRELGINQLFVLAVQASFNFSGDYLGDSALVNSLQACEDFKQLKYLIKHHLVPQPPKSPEVLATIAAYAAARGKGKVSCCRPGLLKLAGAVRAASLKLPKLARAVHAASLKLLNHSGCRAAQQQEQAGCSCRGGLFGDDPHGCQAARLPLVPET